MNAGDSTINRRMQYHAGYALVEVLVESIVAAGRGLSRGFAAIAESQRRAQARYELERLSDRSLKDIGLERDQIDRLFR